MTQEKMSVAKALTELKILDRRIQTEIGDLKAVTLKQGNRLPAGQADEKEFVRDAKASFQKVTDLIGRRKAIKSAVTVSNATQIISFGEGEGATSMTVAEAIEHKNSVEYDTLLRNKLRDQFQTTTFQVDRMNLEVDNKIQAHIRELQGDKDKGHAPKSEDYEAVEKLYTEKWGAKLVDPLKASKKVDALTEGIDDFTLNVDVLLQESNAKTVIDVEY